MDWAREIERARDGWHEASGLFIALGLALAISLALSQLYGQQLAGFAFAGLSTSLILAWLWQRRLPRARHGRITLLVAVDCESRKDAERFRADFVRPLRFLLSQGSEKSAVDLLEVPYARKLEIDTAERARRIQRASRATFVLFGRLRRRDVGSTIWRLDIEGLVSHGEIGHQNQKKLAQEFSELFPHKANIEDQAALPAFEMLSALVDVVAKYVIAIVINVSGDSDRAGTLFKSVAQACESAEFRGEAVIASIRKRLPVRFFEVWFGAAQKDMAAWLQTREPERIAGAVNALEKIPASEKGRPQYLGAMALCRFVGERDVEEAERLLRSARVKNPAFEMSLAFLASYRRDLRSACRHYRHAAEIGLHAQTAREVREFLDWFQTTGERPAELAFIRGFIEYLINRDKERAERRFAEFLRLAPPDRYANERKLIPKWIAELAGSGTARHPIKSIRRRQ